MIINYMGMRLRKFIILWENPLWSGLFALIIYTLISSLFRSPVSISKFPYFNYLADAFLNGQTNLRLIPSDVHDLLLFDGKYYIYWPPLPAILMLPFIAIFGVGFSDVLFTLVFAGLNVSLVALFLKYANSNGLINLSQEKRAWLVLFFALGTVHITLAPIGRVWFTGQIISFTFTALMFIIPLKYRNEKGFLLLGLMTLGAMFTRFHLVFLVIWPLFFLWQGLNKFKLAKRLWHLSLTALPIIVGGLLFGLYNSLRFGQFFEFGLDYQILGELFLADHEKYGFFYLGYFRRNFYYQYIAYPFPYTSKTFIGGSLFLLSPVFFSIFWGFKRFSTNKHIWFLLISIFLVNIPILFILGTGWVQFGPRYSLDFMMPLLLLTSFGINRWPKRVFFILTLISIVHYISGAIIFSRNLLLG